jgi:phosphoribosyl 1,2-cyclic phosphodiesterase
LEVVGLSFADPLQIAFDFGVPAVVRPAPRAGGPPLRLVVLGSGSGGNAVVVEADGKRLLIDAGFSCRELVRRMRLVGIEPESISALVLTHEHGDHCRGVVRLVERYGLPFYATPGTLAEMRLTEKSARKMNKIASGTVTEIAGFAVEPFLIPHDAREPVGMVIESSSGLRVGLAADLGNRSQLAWGRLTDLDLFILETNHDLDMLRNGPYPWALKQRVAGRHGHLSNREAADGLPELLGDRLRRVVLYHLSQTNNLPALAAAAVTEILEREGSPAEVVVTEQDQVSPWLEVHA